MTIDDLKALISHGESECLEFKATTGQRTEGAKAVCAMLNGQGGHVLFGVNDRGDLKGQLVTAHTQEEVDRELRRLEPPAFPVIEVVLVHGDHSVIVLKVTAGTQGPFTFDGRPYLRQGPQTLVMPRNRYEDLLLERLHATRRWENDPVPPGVGLKDLDHDEIRRVLNAAGAMPSNSCIGLKASFWITSRSPAGFCLSGSGKTCQPTCPRLPARP